MSNEYNNEIRQMVAYSHMNRFGELDEVYAKADKADEYEVKAKAWDKLHEYVSTTPYDGIDIDTLKNRLNRFLNESSEME